MISLSDVAFLNAFLPIVLTDVPKSIVLIDEQSLNAPSEISARPAPISTVSIAEQPV